MSTKTENTTMTFVEKALAFLNITEENSVSAIQKSAKKIWEKQVSNKTKAIIKLKEDCTETIEGLNEDLADLKGEYSEAFLNVSTDKMGRTERESYITGEYQYQIANALKKVEDKEKEIKDTQSTCDIKVEKLEKEIKMYNSYLAEIK